MPGIDVSPYDALIQQEGQQRQQSTLQMEMLPSFLNGMMQNRLMGQMYNSRVDQTAAIKAATDEQGNIDYGKAAVSLAKTNSAWSLPDFINSVAGADVTKQNAIGKSLENGMLVQQIIGKAALGIAPNQNITDGDVSDTLGLAYHELGASGALAIDPNLTNTFMAVGQKLSGLPNEATIDRTKNPTAMSKQQFLNQIGTQARNTEGVLSSTLGDMFQLDAGGTNYILRGSPQAGVTQMGTVQKTPAPALVPSVGPGLQPGVTQYSGQQGAVNLGGGGGAPATTQFPGGSTSGQPIAGGNTPAPQQPAATQGGGTSGFIPTGPGPEQEAPVDRFNKEFSTTQDTLTSMQQTAMQLKELQNDMNQVQTGGGTTAREKLAVAVQALQHLVPGLHISDEMIKKIQGGDLGSAQAAMKLAYFASGEAMRGAIGAGRITNNEMSMASSSYPNLDTDPHATEKMNALFQRQLNALQTKVKAMTMAQNEFATDPSKLNNFDTDWNDHLTRKGWTNLTPELDKARRKWWGLNGQQ